MDVHVAPVSVVAARKRVRKQYDQDLISRMVTEARHVGPQAAAQKVNASLPVDERVPEDTVRTWLHRYKKEGNFWESDPKKRGRKSIVDLAPPAAHAEWSKQIASVRGQGESVTARVSAAVGRAVLAEKAPSLLERHGGLLK